MGFYNFLSSSVFLIAAILAHTLAQDYVIAHDDEELLYATSEVYPRQLSVINSSSQIGVVVDSTGEKVLVLNGETGRGIVLDRRLKIGFEISQGGWSVYKQSLPDYLKDCNLQKLVDENPGNVFEIDESSHSEAEVFIHDSLTQFSPGFLEHVVQNSDHLFSGLLRFFGYIIHPLKYVLGPLLSLAAPAYIIFKGGFLVFLNIIKWLGKLIANITGGLGVLVAAAVMFPLTAIIMALDGAKAFFIILKAIAERINLMTILRAVLTVPAQIIKFIVGLGGLMLRGVTGIFTILAKLFTFSIWKIASVVKSFTEMILNFLSGRRISYEEVQESVSSLLEIPRQQAERYEVEQDYQPYKEVIGSVAGQGGFAINGIKVGPFVKVITETTQSAKAVVMSAFNMLSPLIPFNVVLPHLLVNMVKSLNTTKGPSYIQQLIPSIKIPKDGLYRAGEAFRSSESSESLEEMRNLPAPELMRSLPIVSDIYHELDDAALRYSNVSLDSLLESHHVGELVEFTTKAFGLI